MAAINERNGPARLPGYAFGIDLDSWDSRLPHTVAMALLERTVEATGDQELGLHAAEAFTPEDVDVFDRAICSSETIRDAIETMSRYLRLLHDAAQLALEVEGPVAAWSFGVSSDLTWLPQCSDYAAGLLLHLLRRASGGTLELREVRLRHDAPADASEYERFFGAKVQFGSVEDALVFDARILTASVQTRDPGLYRIMRRHADMLMQRLPPAPRFRDAVEAAIRSQLESRQLDLDQLTRRLGVSERTLRRRLEQEGTSYLELLEEVRRELALRWLSRSGRRISEIAFILGFSRTPSFYKAFHRWTGMAPARYRAAQAEKSGVRATAALTRDVPLARATTP